MRLASAAGMVQLHWEMPWVGRLDVRVDLDGRRWSHEIVRFEDSPANPVALVILSPPHAGVDPLPARRRRR